MTKCCFLIFLWKINAFWLLDHSSSLKTRRAKIDWIYAKIGTFWWKNQHFGSKNHIRPDGNISTWTSSTSFWPLATIDGAKTIYVSWRNISETFGQHSGNICCLNFVLNTSSKTQFSLIFRHTGAFKATFRQQVLPKCWPNVDFWIFHQK